MAKVEAEVGKRPEGMLGGLIVLQVLFRDLLGDFTAMGYVGICLTLPTMLIGGLTVGGSATQRG